MNKLSVLASAVLFIVFSSLSYAQKPDDVLGFWLNYEKDAQIEVVKKGNKYFGTIVWLKNPKNTDGSPKTDKENPDEKLRTRKTLGLEILKNFEYDKGDNEWDDGSIYDPKSGSTYKAYLWFENGDLSKMMLRGYIGFSLIGKTSEWTRDNAKR